MRDGFIFYSSFYEAINELNVADQLSVYQALCQYALTDTEPDITGVAAAMFKLMKPQIDANNRRRENGKKGGRPKADDKQMETKTKPKQNQSETKVEAKEKEKGKEKGKEKEKGNNRFSPPTVDEVRAYSIEKGYLNFDADRFVDYYSSNGWMVGRTKMKDWKAAVRNWHARDKADKKPSGTKFNNFTQRTESLDELMRKGLIG